MLSQTGGTSLDNIQVINPTPTTSATTVSENALQPDKPIETEKVKKTAKKTRKRTTTIARACTHCRSKHVKCDGRLPCSKCIKSSVECIYPPRKIRNKKRSDRNPSNPQVYINSLMKPTPNHKSEVELFLSSNLSDYAKSFLAHYGTGLELPITSLELESANLIENFRAQTKIGILVNSILSGGALLKGQISYANEFIQNARNLMRNFYDETDIVVASSYYLMSCHYEFFGEQDRAKTARSTAGAIAEILYKRDPDSAINLQLSTVSHYAEQKFGTNAELQEFSNRLQSMAKCELLSESTRLTTYIFSVILQIFSHSVSEVKDNFEENIQLLNTCDNVIQNSHMNSNTYFYELHMHVTLWKSCLCYFYSKFEDSEQLANQTLELVQNFSVFAPEIAVFIYILKFLYLQFEKFDKMEQLEVEFKKFECFPFATALQENFPFLEDDKELSICSNKIVQFICDAVANKEQTQVKWDKYLYYRNQKENQTVNSNTNPIQILELNNPTQNFNRNISNNENVTLNLEKENISNLNINLELAKEDLNLDQNNSQFLTLPLFENENTMMSNEGMKIEDIFNLQKLDYGIQNQDLGFLSI